MPKKMTIGKDRSTTLRFNMKQDEDVRSEARRGYELSKVFKEIGIRLKRIVPASCDASVRKLFRLPVDSGLICLEVQKTGNEEEDIIKTGEVKDQLLLMDNVRLVDESQYVYESNNIVYRFLVKFDK